MRLLDYEIAPEELKALLDGEADVVVLDVREPWEIETARIDGQQNIPMSDIPARFNRSLIRRSTSWSFAITACAR